MSTPVFVGSAFVAEYPQGGGVFWVPLQYVLGLRGEGLDAYWLELLPGSGDRERDQRRIMKFFKWTGCLGIGDRVVMLYMPKGRDGECHEWHSPAGLTEREIGTRMRDAVLLNLSNSIPARFLDNFARTVLYDIDPGMLQLWSTQWGMGVGEHDLYFTIGQRIGRIGCAVPTLGVQWNRTWPIVYLPAWPMQSGSGQRYTTVTQWWNGNGGFDLIDGELYEQNKRTSFLEFIDLPRCTGLPLELAANITLGEKEDRALLAENGWILADPHEAASTPLDYRRYIQSSRGEFGCAKPSFVKLAAGWISDRTVCYLASGRPCVVQATGAEHELPRSLGLQFFSNKTEAVEALRAAERNYDCACIEARRLAETFFSTRSVIPEIAKIIGLH